MRKSVFTIALIVYVLPIRAMIVFSAMFFSGFTGGVALLTAGAVVLMPFTIAVWRSAYGRLAKTFMRGCAASAR